MKLDNDYITLMILLIFPVMGLILGLIEAYKIKYLKKIRWKFQVIIWILVIFSFFISNNLSKLEDYFRLRKPNLLSKYETVDLGNMKYVLLGSNKDTYTVAECKIKGDTLIIYKNTIKEIERLFNGKYEYREYKEVREELN